MIYSADKYAKGLFPMPDRDDEKITSKEKDGKKYNLSMAQAVYKEFCRGATYVNSDAYSTVDEYRSYAYGNQSAERYIDSFFGRNNDDTVSETLNTDSERKRKRKAFNSLNFDIQSPAPRMMDAIIGRLTESVHMVSVDAVDKFSGAQKENAKWGAWVDKVYGDKINAAKALMAIPSNGQDKFVPENMEELSLYEAEGGFKPSYATTMEVLLKYAMERSNWDEALLEKHLKDLVTVGFTAGKDVYDPSTGQVTTEYINAKNVGVQYTSEDSYRKPDFGFYLKMVKLSDLRKKGFKEEDLNAAAEKFQNEFGNDRYEDPNSVNKQYEYGYSRQSDKYVVPVFVVNWIDVDYKKEYSHENRFGRKKTFDYVDGKTKLGKKDEIITTRIKTVREVSWIVDTDLVYDYGRMEYQCRDGLADPVLPIHMVKVSGKPIIPRLIPSLDLYMMAWLKFQQGIRLSAMNGFAVDMAILNNINLGGKKMNPKDVIKAYRETGFLFFSSENINGRHNVQNTRPIEQLPGGAGAVIAEAVSGMDLAMRQMEQLTGINPLSMGESPSPDAGKAVSEFSIMGTNDILKNVVRKANILKSDIARNMCLRLQYVIKNHDTARKAYVDVVGESQLELIRMAEGHDVKYGIRTHARPTDQDIRDMKELVALSLKNGRDGKTGITEADAIRFNFMLNSGESPKKVALLLGVAEKKAQRLAEERARRSQELDQQGAAASDARKAQMEQAKLFAETQSRIAEENIKGRNTVLAGAVSANKLSYDQALMLMGLYLPQQQQVQQQPQQTQAVPTNETGIPTEGEMV